MKKKEQKNDMAGEGRRQGSDYQGRGDDPSEVYGTICREASNERGGGGGGGQTYRVLTCK